ncbi:MAG: SpoIIE family protein phosphatase [Thiohalocapsa sp.]
MKALVIDDAMDIRLTVRMLLESWGHTTDEASNARDGFALIEADDVQLVVCDWMMPGTSGPDLCRLIREADLGHYVYFILLTARTDRADLLEGLDAGADDFLTKPLDANVLRARLHIAERILGLEQRLAEQNRDLQASRNGLKRAYEGIRADLRLAARVQRQMLPRSDSCLMPLRADWVYLPAAEISGDSFNFFELDADLIGFYQLDVSGHGIPSALLSAGLSRSILPTGDPSGANRASFLDPTRFLADLNEQLGDPDGEVEHFATIVYGTLDKHTGEGRLALAGHPLPILVRRGGAIETLRPGGLPAGMFPQATYESQRLSLGPGDRLLLYSDGVTECRSPTGELFGDERLHAIVAAAADSSAEELAAVLEARLRDWRGTLDFEDDISILVLERPAPLARDTPMNKTGKAEAVSQDAGSPPSHDSDGMGSTSAIEHSVARIALSSDPAEVVQLQMRLTVLCDEAGLDELAAFQWTCAIVEAVNNCIEHAYDGEAGHPISLRWARNADAVVVEIRDRGRSMRAPLSEREMTLEAESGRGLHIIRQWTDSAVFTAHEDENVLTLTRRFV